MPKLTKRTIDATRPQKSQFFLWDSELQGFGLRVFPSGTKKFVIQYRNAQGATRRMSLGSYGRLSPAQARELAKTRLAEVHQGSDPSLERQRRREAPLLEDLAERFLSEHVEKKRKPRTALEYRRIFEKHVLPRLGKRLVEEITAEEVHRLHGDLAATPYQANRVLAVLSAAFSLAERWGLRPRASNPCQDVERYREKARERYLSSVELAQLGQALKEVEEAEEEPAAAVLAIRLLLFTGCRKSEVLTLRWDHVDLERGILFLPDSKTGAKAVPLGAPAVELLAQAPHERGNPWVIPGRNPGSHLIGLPHIWERIRAKAGLEDVRLHDLRHSHAATGAGAGLSLPVIGKLLGHTQPQTTARYAHLADDPLKRAADRVAGEIAAALDGERGEAREIPSGRRKTERSS